MTSISHLGLALALSVAILLGFTLLRRVMRMQKPPRFLDSDVLAFSVSILFTVLLMISMISVGFAIQPLVGSEMLTFVITLVYHLLLWMALRAIIPVDAALPAGSGMLHSAGQSVAGVVAPKVSAA